MGVDREESPPGVYEAWQLAEAVAQGPFARENWALREQLEAAGHRAEQAERERDEAVELLRTAAGPYGGIARAGINVRIGLFLRGLQIGAVEDAVDHVEDAVGHFETTVVEAIRSVGAFLDDEKAGK